MTSFLVVYGSGEGQTAKVAEYVEDALVERGDDVTVRDATEGADVAIDEFDAVLVGSPVNNRRHLPAVVEFVESNRDALAARPTAFFELSFASVVSARWGNDGEEGFVDSLVQRTGWQPDRVGCFAGAVKYTQYDRLTRSFFRLFSAVTTGDTDTSRDYEYTDWDEVEAFAADFAAFVEQHDSVRASDAGTGTDGEAGGVPGPTGGGFARSAAVVALFAGALVVAYWLVVRR